jgi:hypothetical protein
MLLYTDPEKGNRRKVTKKGTAKVKEDKKTEGDNKKGIEEIGKSSQKETKYSWGQTRKRKLFVSCRILRDVVTSTYLILALTSEKFF